MCIYIFAFSSKELSLGGWDCPSISGTELSIILFYLNNIYKYIDYTNERNTQFVASNFIQKQRTYQSNK